MTNRERLLICCLFLLLAFGLGFPTSAPAADRPPNIIFIIADDLGYGDLGCYGQKIIRTPNLDRMAAEGMRLTQHYSGNAVCAPSRSVLMTGLHPGHAYTRDNTSIKPEGQWPIPDAAVTTPELFKTLGYTTGGFGKWGLGGPGTVGEPLKQGFDRWYGYNCQGVAHNFYPTYLWDNDQKVSLNNPDFPSKDKLQPGEDPNDPRSYDRFKGKEYSADLISAQAHKFIRDNKDRPFYLYWPTTVPHLALQVPDESLTEYIGKFDDPPYPGGNGYLPHFKPRAAYAAMITRMDAEIGKAMAIVKELGLDDNTIFAFVSDNGGLNGTHQGLAGTDAAFFNSCGGLRDGKGTLYEGGTRVPGIIRWSGKIKPNQTSDRIVGFEDWMPTLLDLAGTKDKAPKTIDGISFAPTLLGEKQPDRPFLYREFPGYGGQQSIRIGQWKGIRTGINPRANAKKKANPNAKAPKIDMHIVLYDLTNDPTETKDVSADHPEIISKMETILREQHKPNTDYPFPALDG